MLRRVFLKYDGVCIMRDEFEFYGTCIRGEMRRKLYKTVLYSCEEEERLPKDEIECASIHVKLAQGIDF